MSDEICICGHRADEHKLVKRTRDGKVIGRFHCAVCAADPKRRCGRYKRTIDWPDERGIWWWDYGLSREIVCAAHFSDRGGLSLLRIGQQCRVSRDDAKAFGPARFTKAEPNPFPSKN